MKSLESKFGFGATILSLILAIATSVSCNKKEKVFATIEVPQSHDGIKYENPAMPYYRKALDFQKQGQLDSALFYSQKVIDNRNIVESESLANVHVCRAEIFQQQDKNNEAIESYEKAIYYYSSQRMTKECIPIYLEMANIYEKANNKEKADECKRLAERFEEYLQLH